MPRAARWKRPTRPRAAWANIWPAWPSRRFRDLRRPGPRRWISTDWCATTSSAKDRTWPTIRVNLAAKRLRKQQSHEIVLRIRDDLTRLAEQSGANIKLVESPPGPPVISTITAEVYGPARRRVRRSYRRRRARAQRLDREPGVADVDASAESDQPEGDLHRRPAEGCPVGPLQRKTSPKRCNSRSTVCRPPSCICPTRLTRCGSSFVYPGRSDRR